MEAIKYNSEGALRDVLFKEMYISAYDKSQLHIAEWWPEKFPRALVILVHGLGDHILRYKQLANYFNNNQIAVIGLDLRGHGKSEGRRGASFYSSMLYDYVALIDYAKKKYPNIPKILYGHSFGGNLAMNFVMRNKTSFAGIISSSPWLQPVYQPAFLSHPYAKYLKLFYSVIISRTRVKADYLSQDTNLVLNYKNDKMVHNRINLNLFRETCRAGRTIMRNKHKFSIPTLLMHGSGDKVTSCAASADFAKNTSSNTNFKLWHGAYHELHNESEKEEVYDYMLNWILNLPQIQR